MTCRAWLGVLVAVGLASFVWSVSADALDVPPAPTLAMPIVDQTNTLSDTDKQKLADQISKSRQTKSYQIGILIIPTLGSSEYLEGYSIKVARQWGVGERDKNNGVLIVIVKNDRLARIEVGRGMEGDLTDVRSGQIIRNVIAPAFRAGDYAGGLSRAVDSIQLAVSSETDPNLQSSSDSSDWTEAATAILVIGTIIISWVVSMLARSKSWWAGGVVGFVIGIAVALMFSWVAWTWFVVVIVTIVGLIVDYAVSKNYRQHRDDGTMASWWAGGGGFGGSSGGGGGFGGGGFGGGGSSGSW